MASHPKRRRMDAPEPLEPLRRLVTNHAAERISTDHLDTWLSSLSEAAQPSIAMVRNTLTEVEEHLRGHRPAGGEKYIAVIVDHYSGPNQVAIVRLHYSTRKAVVYGNLEKQSTERLRTALKIHAGSIKDNLLPLHITSGGAAYDNMSNNLIKVCALAAAFSLPWQLQTVHFIVLPLWERTIRLLHATDAAQRQRVLDRCRFSAPPSADQLLVPSDDAQQDTISTTLTGLLDDVFSRSLLHTAKRCRDLISDWEKVTTNAAWIAHVGSQILQHSSTEVQDYDFKAAQSRLDEMQANVESWHHREQLRRELEQRRAAHLTQEAWLDTTSSMDRLQGETIRFLISCKSVQSNLLRDFQAWCKSAQEQIEGMEEDSSFEEGSSEVFDTE